MADHSENAEYIDAGDGPLRVLQLTDTHLCRERGGKLLGMDTDHSLQAVVELALRERGDSDLLLATGDLADRGAREAYVRARHYFARLGCPVFWLTGNHDSRSAMTAVAADTTLLCGEIRSGSWQILMLDSQLAGEVGGELGSAELERLDRALQAAAEAGLYSLICLHHHPVLIGSRWLDAQRVADAAEFFAVLDRYPGVRGVLWGHIHQQVDRERRGVQLMGSPSTCVQFAPGSDSFRADDLAPGYRWLELQRDGRIDTGVSRVDGVAFDVDLNSNGYL